MQENSAALSQSLQTASWLVESDRPMVEVLRLLARRMDYADEQYLLGAIDSNEKDSIKFTTTSYSKFLGTLGLSPASRKNFDVLRSRQNTPPDLGEAIPLEDSLRRAKPFMPWLNDDMDEALFNHALWLAESIDQGTEEFYSNRRDSTQYNKDLIKVSYLVGELKDLGCTPLSRQEILGLGTEQENTPIDELKAKRKAKQQAAEARRKKREAGKVG